MSHKLHPHYRTSELSESSRSRSSIAYSGLSSESERHSDDTGEPQLPITPVADHRTGTDQDAITPAGIIPASHDLDVQDTSHKHDQPVNDTDTQEVPSKVKISAQAPLRYRRRTIYLLAFYIPTLVIPWTLTCVLAVRPLNASSYVSQWGGISAYEILNIYGWVAAIRVLNSVNGVAAIPVVSALLAQAAVVYCQRRKAKQALSVRQMFALADRGWSDVTILWGAFGSNETGLSSHFLWFAAILVATSAIQQPIQQLLVLNQEVSVMTCLDHPYRSCDFFHFPIFAGYDPEPGDMALIPQNIVVKHVANKISTTSDQEVQPRLWPDNPYTDKDLGDSFMRPANRETFFWYNSILESFDRKSPGREYFVTALQNGTTTGVLREHAMRLNSSVACDHVPRSSFPSSCTGSRPFTASFIRSGLEIRVCVPGEYGVYPWQLSRNRQDLSEEMFLDVYVPGAHSVLTNANFTLHCAASTTRGYFELGNYRNNYSYGPLIDKWPEPEDMLYNFNDYLGWWADYLPPSESDATPGYNGSIVDWGTWPVDPFYTHSLKMSGPLTTSAIAIFGNESFFYIASNSSNETFPPAKAQICQQGNIPFQHMALLEFYSFQGGCSNINSRWNEQYGMDDGDLATLLYNWALGFNDTDAAEEALSMSMFFANEAMLTKTVDYTWALTARGIFTSPGIVIIKPAKTIAATVIISTLVLLQLIGIAYTVYYIYKIPIWTAALDALAVARIGISMDKDDLPPIGAVSDEDYKKLMKVDGLVGVVIEEPLEVIDSELSKPEAAIATTSQAAPPFQLGRGALGVITRRLAPRKLSRQEKKKKKKEKEKNAQKSQEDREMLGSWRTDPHSST